MSAAAQVRPPVAPRRSLQGSHAAVNARVAAQPHVPGSARGDSGDVSEGTRYGPTIIARSVTDERNVSISVRCKLDTGTKESYPAHAFRM